MEAKKRISKMSHLSMVRYISGKQARVLIHVGLAMWGSGKKGSLIDERKMVLLETRQHGKEE